MKILSYILLLSLFSVLNINAFHFHTQNSTSEIIFSEFEEELDCDLCDVINFSDDNYIIIDYIIKSKNSVNEKNNKLLNNNGIIGALFFKNRAPPTLIS